MITVIDNITYLLDGEKRTATVTKSLTPYEGEVVVPATVISGGAEFVVSDILDEAFAGCCALRSVVLGENVESVGISSFEGCTALESLRFAGNAGIIGMSAFKGCTALRSVVLPHSIMVIGREAFAGCTALESVALPDNLVNIEPSLFDGCSALKSAVIGKETSSIGE